ncbi:hypothetical protein GCM10012275_18250 [Longimycelium tulufanense]|uniref:Peptidase S1 domain-containing protein n=1 Tax=Longimycelium tulufanense TaxID=907463 RepID=A0A8J3CCJ7_9PSEU|nr:S1 family peptidase [Longimycelium tulufanense]GGM47505.1 hypothetical protein GCM10012275_18250 [Longimycelium tulufanense]
MRWTWFVPMVSVLAGVLPSPPADAAELPPDLTAAIRRDLGLSPPEYLSTAAAAGAAADALGRLRERLGPDLRHARFDGSTRTLVLGVRPGTRVPEVPGTAVRAVPTPAHGPAAPKAVVPFLRAGEGISTSRDGRSARCTAGFVLRGRDGGTAMLTAGHCGRPGEPVFSQAGRQVGEFDRIVSDDLASGGQGDDYAVIRLRGRARPEVDDHRGGRVWVSGAVEPVVGMPVCKAGRTTGWTCGTVTETAVRVRSRPIGGEPRLLQVFMHDACAEAGDSGGPVLSGTRAVGVVHGGQRGPDGRCPARSGGPNETAAEPLVTDVLPDLADRYVLLVAPNSTGRLFVL